MLERLFSSAPQPAVPTQAAAQSGELIGRHLVNLICSCGELNLTGFHSAAVGLFRPMEDALDCLVAVTRIAGAAERWLMGRLKPSEAAKQMEQRVRYTNAATGQIEPAYRKQVRSVLNESAHCSPPLVRWDLFREDHPSEPNTFRMRVNHEKLVIESNARKLESFLIAHCAETLEAVERGYPGYFASQPARHSELLALKDELKGILRERLALGLLIGFAPPELQILDNVISNCNPQKQPVLQGNWIGGWNCRGMEQRQAKLTLKQDGMLLSGWLSFEVDSDEYRIGVQEELIGVVEGTTVLFDGITSQLRPASDQHQFSLDTFHLILSEDGKELAGTHRCALGSGDAQFKRR